MDKILEQVRHLISESIEKYLPDVKLKDLEDNGAIFYMNGQNGTEWDYFVNEHLSFFMVFYNDKSNLGAVKLSLFSNGCVTLYLYNEKGNNLVKTIDTKIDVEGDNLLKFATLLKIQMDDKRNWDANIDKIDLNNEPSEEEINDFKNSEKDFESTKTKFLLMPKIAFVSRKILDEGYKVGYMLRDEAADDKDSGWQFLAGNEDDEYMKNHKNIAIMSVKEVCDLDYDVFDYLLSPVGSRFIRISSSEFEEDHEDKEIFVEKR